MEKEGKFGRCGEKGFVNINEWTNGRMDLLNAEKYSF